jgi:hypothetical protein
MMFQGAIKIDNLESALFKLYNVEQPRDEEMQDATGPTPPDRESLESLSQVGTRSKRERVKSRTLTGYTEGIGRTRHGGWTGGRGCLLVGREDTKSGELSRLRKELGHTNSEGRGRIARARQTVEAGDQEIRNSGPAMQTSRKVAVLL